MKFKRNKPNGRSAQSSRGKQQDKVDRSAEPRLFIVVSRNRFTVTTCFLSAETAREAAHRAKINLPRNEEHLFTLPADRGLFRRGQIVQMSASSHPVLEGDVLIWTVPLCN